MEDVAVLSAVLTRIAAHVDEGRVEAATSDFAEVSPNLELLRRSPISGEPEVTALLARAEKESAP